MKLLLVEDDERMGPLLLERLLSILRIRFPLADIVLFTKFADALRAVRELPRPDVALVDLSLSDSGEDDTLSKLDLIDSEVPVVIVTGHDPDRIRAKMTRRDIEIIFKEPSMWNGFGIVRAIIGALQRALAKADREKMAEIRSKIDRMGEIRELISAQIANASPE